MWLTSVVSQGMKLSILKHLTKRRPVPDGFPRSHHLVTPVSQGTPILHGIFPKVNRNFTSQLILRHTNMPQFQNETKRSQEKQTNYKSPLWTYWHKNSGDWFLLFYIMWILVCVCECKVPLEPRGPLELELQAVMSCLMWMLGLEFGFSTTVVHAFNDGAICINF